jgi:hypothetical protein
MKIRFTHFIQKRNFNSLKMPAEKPYLTLWSAVMTEVYHIFLNVFYRNCVFLAHIKSVYNLNWNTLIHRAQYLKDKLWNIKYEKNSSNCTSGSDVNTHTRTHTFIYTSYIVTKRQSASTFQYSGNLKRSKYVRISKSVILSIRTLTNIPYLRLEIEEKALGNDLKRGIS